MEPSLNHWRIASHSNGNSWVNFYFPKWWNFFWLFLVEFSLYHRFQSHRGNVIPLFLLILCGTVALLLVFIICELGQRITDAFEEIGFTIQQSDWYLFPIKIKQMLPMIIANAQKPATIECFGSITCARDTFESVCTHWSWIN